jgi:23S rRNA (uracil1939-C5)-methyltransferase
VHGVLERLHIKRLGAKADGIADTADGAVFVAGALPGEDVLAEREGNRAHLQGIEAPSVDRERPFCPYFGRCGGCATQHMSHGLYRSWKKETVAAALRHAGIGASLGDLVDAHGDGRRRITLHGRFAHGVQVGYMAARSHAVVEISHCPIAEPALRERAPEVARSLASALSQARKPLDIQITATAGGLDIDLRGHGPVDDRAGARLCDLAESLDLARLSLHGELLLERRPPAIMMGRAQVVPPPGSFLQATRRGEEILAEFVVNGCRDARSIADLFSGCGPFALRLAERAEVHAVEIDRASVVALDRATRATPGLRRVTTEARDLFRRPLLGPELDRFAAVVLDPPRAGAEAQTRQIAGSKVSRVVSVSCDAGTFARDAALLIAAGFTLEHVVPVDQFKHSPHVEIVGYFRREPPRRARRRL